MHVVMWLSILQTVISSSACSGLLTSIGLAEGMCCHWSPPYYWTDVSDVVHPEGTAVYNIWLQATTYCVCEARHTYLG